MNRSNIGRRNKRFGSSEERRIARKLSKATGLWFERQVLSGSDKRHRGDIVCHDGQMHYCEVKYRRNLVEKSMRRGCKMVTKFIEDLPANQTCLLIVVTGGGTKNWRKKGMKKDWIFCEREHAWRCPPIHRLGAMVDPVDTQPFRGYQPHNSWVYANLDEALKIRGAVELLGIGEEMANYGLAKLKDIASLFDDKENEKMR